MVKGHYTNAVLLILRNKVFFKKYDVVIYK